MPAEADRGGHRRADEAGFAVRCANDGDLHHIRLDLAPGAGLRSAARHANFAHSNAGSLDGSRKNVAHRHGDAFQDSPQEIVGIVFPRQSFERTPHVRTPDRRSLAGEIG